MASVNEWAREFATEEAAAAWASSTRARLLWAEKIGLLKLVNSADRRWGHRGFEHLGYECDPQNKHTRLTYRRMGTYVGKWMCMRDAPVHKDDKDEVFPIDLTGLLTDKREMVRAPFPFKAAEHKKNWSIPSSWTIGEDGYYWVLSPDMMWPMDDCYWSPICTVQEELF